MELLVRQVLNLDRPWRERRDMLSGILSAASVEDRQRVMKNLDKRFDMHAEIDDFEIAPRLQSAKAKLAKGTESPKEQRRWHTVKR